MTSDSPFQFRRYIPRQLEIVDTTLREGSQTSLLHDHHKYFFSQADIKEFGLRCLSIPQPYRDAVVQHLDARPEPVRLKDGG